MKRVNTFIIVIAFILSLLMFPKTYSFCYYFASDAFTAIRLNMFMGDSTPLESANDDKAKIIFMFGDGWKSVFSQAYPIFKKYGLKGSVAIIPSMVKEKEYMSFNEIGELYREGWDMLNHSYSHSEGMYNHCEDLLKDFNRARDWMNKRYLTKSDTMAVLPYGEVNPYMINLFIDAGYENVRTSDNILVINNGAVQYHYVKTISLLTNVAVSEVEAFLSDAWQGKKTILFSLHKIDEKADGFHMTFDPQKLEDIIFYIHENPEKYQVITYSKLFQ